MKSEFTFLAIFAGVGFAILAIFLRSLYLKQKERFTQIKADKKKHQSSEQAVQLKREQMKIEETTELNFQIETNINDVLAIRRSIQNISRILSNLLKEVPTSMHVDSNLFAKNVSFATSSYIKTTLQQMLKNSARNGATHVSIDHKELVRSNRLVYRDNRIKNTTDTSELFSTMTYNDPMFDIKVNKPTGVNTYDIDFIFTKSDEPRRVGKIYEPSEIDELYGTTVDCSYELNIEELKLYLNQSKHYIFFRLNSDEFIVAKDENKKRIALNQDTTIDQNTIFCYWSVSMVRDLLKQGRGTTISFQNRVKDGKTTLVASFGTKFLQSYALCPSFCPDKINALLN